MGYCVFSWEVLELINFNVNFDDFVFDNEMFFQIIYVGFYIVEVICLIKYFEEVFFINFVCSSKYGLGVLWVFFSYLLQWLGLGCFCIYEQLQKYV